MLEVVPTPNIAHIPPEVINFSYGNGRGVPSAPSLNHCSYLHVHKKPSFDPAKHSFHVEDKMAELNLTGLSTERERFSQKGNTSAKERVDGSLQARVCLIAGARQIWCKIT